MSRNRQIPPTVGTKFDKWEVIGVSYQAYSVLCRCTCGKERHIRYRHLYSQHTRSCLQCSSEKIAAKKTRHGFSSRKTNRTPTYRSWAMMISRCRNPNVPSYNNYGGRGIKVCDRWLDFANFLADMGERPSLAYSIDRFPDNNGNYEPSNCRWATRKQQTRNTRRNKLIEFNGKTQTLVEWSEELNISMSLLSARLGHLGWTIQRALTTPVARRS
jgi:hypothetical protein